MFNLELSVAVLTEIELTEREGTHGWSQENWATAPTFPKGSDLVTTPSDYGETYVGYGTCGTAKCFGGWALTLAGIKMLWNRCGAGLCVTYAEDGRTVSRVARTLLGIDDAPSWCEDCDGASSCEAHHLWNYGEDMPALFDPDNSLDDLYRMVAEHAELEEEVLRKQVADALEKRLTLSQAQYGVSQAGL